MPLSPPTEDEVREAYAATIDGLYAFVLGRCDGDRDLAEDITQEAWLRAVRAWHAKGIPDSPGAWLTTVARNLLANHYRRRPHELLDPDTAGPVPDNDTTERASILSRALSRLPAGRERLLKAFHFDHTSVADIAAEQRLSARAVEGRLRRARQQLRHQIESDPDSEGEFK